MFDKKAYACINTNKSKQLQGSSGGVFSAFAEYIIDNDGIVFGAKMSEDCYSADIISVDNKEDLLALYGSKYLQASVGSSYKKVKDYLVEGKKVLFSGTPCQVNGLKTYLGKEYNNLYCIDVICHGVPSAKLWERYVKSIEKEKGKVLDVKYRYKKNGWKTFGMMLSFENDVLFQKHSDNNYMKMFLKDYSLRPSCYNCNSKSLRLSDITIGDFWGIETTYPELYDQDGVSAIIIRTEHGMEILDYVKNQVKWNAVSYDDVVSFNSAEIKAVSYLNKRDSFYRDMNSMEFDNFVSKYCKDSTLTRAKRCIKNILSLNRRDKNE